MHIEILSNYIPTLEKSLKNISEQLQKPDGDAYRVFDGLPESLWDENSAQKSWECPFYQEVSGWLDARDKEWRSMLYWFEIDANQNPKVVLDKFWKFKTEKPDFRIPALKNNAAKNESRILYVGKKQCGDLKGRIYTHLGYNKPYHPGLQLHHWAQGIPFQLHIWAVWIASESYPLLAAFEKVAAKHLNPLIGKHT